MPGRTGSEASQASGSPALADRGDPRARSIGGGSGSGRYWICGGGCYGSYYVRQLWKAHVRGRIALTELVVLDRNADCAVAAMVPEIPQLRLWPIDWTQAGAELLERADDGDHWVPAPLAPHVALHWTLDAADRAGIAAQPKPWTDALPSLPYAGLVRSGTLVLSHAPGLCPVNCVEPRRCPLTGAFRDWEMERTVEAWFAERGGSVSTHVCAHHAFGVGTIRMGAIRAGITQTLGALHTGRTPVGVATVSGCHGIVDLVERA